MKYYFLMLFVANVITSGLEPPKIIRKSRYLSDMQSDTSIFVKKKMTDLDSWIIFTIFMLLLIKFDIVE